MPRRILFCSAVIALLSLLALLYPNLGKAQTVINVISGKFYRFDIVAENGSTNFVELPNPPSINDQGTVSFNVRIGGGGGWALYQRPSGGGLHLLDVFNGFQETHGHHYGPVTGINNSDTVIVWRTTTTSGNPNTSLPNSFIQAGCGSCGSGLVWANDNPSHPMTQVRPRRSKAAALLYTRNKPMPGWKLTS